MFVGEFTKVPVTCNVLCVQFFHVLNNNSCYRACEDTCTKMRTRI